MFSFAGANSPGTNIAKLKAKSQKPRAKSEKAKNQLPKTNSRDPRLSASS
jgi:hypothetical protein